MQGGNKMNRKKAENKKREYTSSVAAMIMCAVIGISGMGFTAAAKHAAATPEEKPVAYSALSVLTQAGEKAYHDAILK